MIDRLSLAASAAALAVAVASCGSDDEPAGNSTASSTGAGAKGLGAAGGSGGSSAGGSGEKPTQCESCGRAAALGALEDDALGETSGLAASTVLADTWFAHNDSGDSPRFFGFLSSGVSQGTFTVESAVAIDWEDMARGPCTGAGACLYFGDIGDNAEVRSDYRIYRVAEPTTVGDGSLTAEVFPYRYPDGSHNAETLLVHPVTGDIAIVTKVTRGASAIYQFPMPLTPGIEAELVHVGEVKPPGLLPIVTGGDVHPTGAGILLRTYIGLWLYPGTSDESLADQLAREPCPVPFASESQGEAVAWSADGAGYLTLSEGIGAALHGVICGSF